MMREPQERSAKERPAREGGEGRGGAGPPGQGLSSPVAGMLMDRVTRLLGPARGGEGIFLEGRLSEFGVGEEDEGRPKAPFTSRASFRLWDRRAPLQPLGAAWKDLASTAPRAACPPLGPRRSRLLSLFLPFASFLRLSLYVVPAFPEPCYLFVFLDGSLLLGLLLFERHRPNWEIAEE